LNTLPLRWILLLLLAYPLSVCGQTTLSQAASALTPGVWTEFTAAENASWNGGSVLDLGPSYTGADSAVTWSSKGVWDPVNKAFYFTGGGHGAEGVDAPDAFEVLKYDDATNTWSVTYRSGAHSYEGLSLNTTLGDNIYHRPYNSLQVNRYNLSTHVWTNNALPTIPAGSNDCCNGMDYFPDRNSLVTIDQDFNAWEYSFGSGTWACIFNTLSGCGSPRTALVCSSHTTNAPWLRYDSVNHRMLFGGCTTSWSLSTTLAITRLASPPFTISSNDSGSPIAYDSGSGKLVSFDTSGNTFTSDGTSWVNVGSSPFGNPVSGGLACGGITTYNVVMCFYTGRESIPISGAKIYLYKATGPVNGFLNRKGGVNIPGGAGSIVGSNDFSAINPPQTGTPPIDTWTAGTQDDFYIYKPGFVTKDCSVTAEGITGVCALKYTIQPGFSVGDPGWYIWNFKNPGDATGLFGDGQEFYVQYQERIDNMFQPGAYTGTPGNGFKMDLITEADSPTFNSHNCSNSPAQLTVIQDDVNAPFPGAFINCGFSGAAYAFGQGGYQAFQIPISGNYLDQVASGCEHYTDAGHTQYPLGDPTCWNFVQSEWFTVQVHYKIGAFNSPNSVADIWFAHNGQPARLVQQAADAYIPNDNTGPINKYGRIVLLPYNTSSTANVSGAFYYGDLIDSTRRNPDPLVSTPNAPDSLGLSVGPGGITATWRVNSQNGTAQDDTGFLIERCTGTVATCFPAPKSGFAQVATTAAGASSFVDSTTTSGTTYTYRVRAQNLAGNSGYAASICFNGAVTCGGTAIANSSLVASPTFLPVAGTYTGAQNVTISSSTGGATLCYTIDGTTPTANGSGTCTHGTTYSVPVALSSTKTLKAIGTESGFTDSSVTSGLFTINIPSLAPATGFFARVISEWRKHAQIEVDFSDYPFVSDEQR
jgi:hypothetical protein